MSIPLDRTNFDRRVEQTADLLADGEDVDVTSLILGRQTQYSACRLLLATLDELGGLKRDSPAVKLLLTEFGLKDRLP